MQKELGKLILSMQNSNRTKLQYKTRDRKECNGFQKEEKMFSMLNLALFKDL